jgi:hypothetical protein
MFVPTHSSIHSFISWYRCFESHSRAMGWLTISSGEGTQPIPGGPHPKERQGHPDQPFQGVLSQSSILSQ